MINLYTYELDLVVSYMYLSYNCVWGSFVADCGVVWCAAIYIIRSDGFLGVDLGLVFIVLRCDWLLLI